MFEGVGHFVAAYAAIPGCSLQAASLEKAHNQPRHLPTSNEGGGNKRAARGKRGRGDSNESGHQAIGPAAAASAGICALVPLAGRRQRPALNPRSTAGTCIHTDMQTRTLSNVQARSEENNEASRHCSSTYPANIGVTPYPAQLTIRAPPQQAPHLQTRRTGAPPGTWPMLPTVCEILLMPSFGSGPSARAREAHVAVHHHGASPSVDLDWFAIVAMLVEKPPFARTNSEQDLVERARTVAGPHPQIGPTRPDSGRPRC